MITELYIAMKLPNPEEAEDIIILMMFCKLISVSVISSKATNKHKTLSTHHQ